MRMISSLLLLCLSAICNAELRTWTAVNGKEVEAEFVFNEKGIVKLKLKSGKVFEVAANKLSKEDNEFISSIAKLGVNRDELEEREGIIYLKGSDTPYTGKSFDFYENGQMESEECYKDGKLDGLSTSWFKSGQKKNETNFKEGLLEGLTIEWDEQGWKALEMNFKNNELDGLALEWHENGEKRSEVTFKEGKQVKGSRKEWNKEPTVEAKDKLEGGISLEETESRDSLIYIKNSKTPFTGKTYKVYSNGKIEEIKNFKNGKPNGRYRNWHMNGNIHMEGTLKNGISDGLITAWYENGNKRTEGTLKNGISDGLVTFWYKSGNKESESIYMDGKMHGLSVGWYENGKKKSELSWKEGKPVEGSQKFWNTNGELISK